ncbi:MAG: hypothetical protein AAFO67_08260, partial [Planctomycetota bacterium]
PSQSAARRGQTQVARRNLETKTGSKNQWTSAGQIETTIHSLQDRNATTDWEDFIVQQQDHWNRSAPFTWF